MSAVKVIISVATKVAASIPRNNNEEEKNSYPLLIIIVTILSLIVIIPAAVLSTPGILVKNMFNKEDANVDFTISIEDTELYRDCIIIYNDFKNEYNEKVEDIAEQLKRDNTKTEIVEPITVVDGKIVKGEPIEIEVAPSVFTSIDFEDIDIYYLMAYLNTKYFEYQHKDDKYKFNKSEARKFMENITTFTTYHYGTDPIYLNAKITVLTLDEIADIYFKNEITKEGISKRDLFITSYQALKEDNLQ